MLKSQFDKNNTSHYNMYYGGAKMISLRLDPKLEQNVQNTAKILGVTKSELIRKSISEYINKIVHHSPWEIGKGYFGKYSSGQGNLSTDRKILLKTKIMAKRK